MKIRERLRRWSDKLDQVAQEAGLRNPDFAKRRGVYSDPDQMQEKVSIVPGKWAHLVDAQESSQEEVASGFSGASRAATPAPQSSAISETLPPHNTVIDASGKMQEPRRPIISVHGRDVTEDEFGKPAA